MSCEVTIAVLTHGEYESSIRRCLDSIFTYCSRQKFHLVVGANAVGAGTFAYLQSLERNSLIDTLIISDKNLGKSRMMRRLFEHITSEFIWWFDDDSYLTAPGALERRLQHARMDSETVVVWGLLMYNDLENFFVAGDPKLFVRTAPWYRGLPPPSWKPGGKGVFQFEGRVSGDGRWYFVAGGEGFYRRRIIDQLDWPDRRLRQPAEDIFLGEAVRQQGWTMRNIGDRDVVVSDGPTRFDPNAFTHAF